MPFLAPINTVIEKNNLPTITATEKSEKPRFSALMILKGGQGGSFAEKSYKPKVILAETDLSSSELTINPDKIFPYSTTEIKSENDCGYAVNFKTDASNQCDFTLGEYDPYNNLNIYATSELLPFSYLYTGGVSSSAVLASGSAVGDFTLKTNHLGVNYLSGDLDAELNLNKYYLELRNNSAIEDAFYLQKSIDFGNVDNSVFVFYVAQTDLVSGYATYNTGVINFNNNQAGIETVTGGFYDNLFKVDDIIQINHPSGYFNAKATITAKNNITNIYTFKIKESGNFPRTQSVSFPLGSSVSIYDDDSNKLSICAPSDAAPIGIDSYNAFYSDRKDGFQFKIDKKVATNHKELNNSLTFTNDKNLFKNNISDTNAISIDFSFPRIGNRKYMQDQYGTDLIKNQIKNKSKFNIFFHGFERNLSQSNDNTSQAVTNYSCGNEVSFFVSDRQIKQDILGSLSLGQKTIELIIGSPIRSINQIKRCYYSNRIYEVLIYIDLKSSDIPKVLAGLSKKYSQKTNFSSPVEFQTSDMYYSIADKINILGKIKKTST